MWWGSESDPGGSSSDSAPKEQPPQSQQTQDLQEQFKQQQFFIAQLKEMLTKSENTSTVSREKVDEYASTLSEINARAKRSRLKKSENKRPDDESSPKASDSQQNPTASTPAKEKVNLLRQQLEENRIKLAQRDKNQKGIEEMVNQLKAQLNTSQDIISQSKLNVTHAENKSYSAESSREELLSMLSSKDEHILELSAKIQQLQANVLDLQENVKEKDSVIDARTKAITLLSENLSKKGKHTLDMLEDTKEQMRKMQENFVMLESNMRRENLKLQTELSKKEEHLQDVLVNNNTLNEKCAQLDTIKTELEEKLQSAQQELQIRNSEMKTCKCKIDELSKINESLQIRLNEIETAQPDECVPEKAEKAEKVKGKSAKKSKQQKEEHPQVVSIESYVNRIAELEKLLEESQVKTVQQEQSETVAQSGEVQKLTKQLEDMNKNMIKLKAQHKSKLKEMQKKMSSGELNDKIVTLEQENAKLLQGIAELEEEKGNLQLRLVEYESNKDKDYISDLENKIEEQKMEIENHIRSITSLESEITSKSNEISSLRSELSGLMHLENAQVYSEMTSVQLEEQLDKEVSQKKEIQDKYNGILKENESLLEKMEAMNKEKQELSLKLENYMQENMDLIDRLEKLSAEKVSSAESIEIVESLTQQEKLEIEAYQKNLEFSAEKPSAEENTELEQSPEFNESVTKLSDEASELMERIELFTVERREVMEKMDLLSSENHQLIEKLEKYEIEKSDLERKYDGLRIENEDLTKQLHALLDENKALMAKIEEYTRERDELAMENTLRENRELKKAVEQCQLLVEEQKQEIVRFQEELLRQNGIVEEKAAIESNLLVMVSEKQTLEELNTTLTDQLAELQNQHDLLRKENQENKHDHLELNEAQRKLQELLYESQNQVLDLEAQIDTKISEINSLKKFIEENKNKWSETDATTTQLQNQLKEKVHELKTTRNEIDNLQKLVTELNNEIEHKDATIRHLSEQVSGLKDIVSEDFKELQTYGAEIANLNESLQEFKQKLQETEHIIAGKDAENNQLQAEKSKAEILVKELKSTNDNFVETCYQLKEKCQFLENQIKTTSGCITDIQVPFEEKIHELELRNKEQVEKMKKIAANLKKKATVCQELETKLSDVTQKWETESREKDEVKKIADEYKSKLEESTQKIMTLSNQLGEIDGALCTLQLNFASKNEDYEALKTSHEEQFERFQSQTEVLNNKINDYENILKENSKLRTEVFEFNEANRNLQIVIEENQKEIYNLNIQIDTLKVTMEAIKEQSVQELLNKIEMMKSDYETKQRALEAKLQEKDAFIESLDVENSKYKERVFKLEEGLSTIEERREALEQKAMDLKTELEAKSTECEEAFQTEDLLEQRLATLLKHDEFIEKKLERAVLENQSLSNQLEQLLKENGDFAQRLSRSESKLKHTEQNDEKIEFLESEVARLLETISGQENELKKLHADYQHSLAQKNTEIENLESDLSAQVQELGDERKHLHTRCEMLQDEINEYVNNEQLLAEEIEQLKEKVTKLKRDLEMKCEENEQLVQSNASYLTKLQEFDKDTTDRASRTEEDASLKSELDKLQQIIAQKDVDIQNYQRQNMQLQMASFGGATQASPFAVPFAQNTQSEVQNLSDLLEESRTRCNALEEQVSQLSHQLTNKQHELQQLSHALDENRARCIALEEQVLLHQGNAQNEQLEESNARNKILEEQVTNLTQQLSTPQNRLHQELENLSQDAQVIREEIYEKHEQKHNTAAVPVGSECDVKKEELLKKIKALEFMLYNVEKEKDDALVQCHELLNELTRLIYEREKFIKGPSARKPNTEMDLAMVESEIIQGQDVNRVAESEYVRTTRDFFENIPVQGAEEPLIQAKTAYLCYDDKPGRSEKHAPKSDDRDAPKRGEIPIEGASAWGVEDLKIAEALGSQIIQPESIPVSPQEKQQLQFLEFEHVRTPRSPTLRHPVSEEIPAPRDAYLCYPDDCKGILTDDTFASEEDGWGWTAEEAKLEAAHVQSLAASAPAPTQSEHVQQLEDKISDLELERARLLEEMKISQVRSGKLIKKLKDMKLKNDTLVAELSKKHSGDDLLDMAIQDELNTQIKNLEKTIKELTDELNKEKCDRENLLKRNEVLNSANERMVELKEKQDNEVQFLQFKNRELSAKLEQLEWGDDAFSSKSDEKSPKRATEAESSGDRTQLVDELSKRVQELTATLNELTLDNEEMQCMLEEQRKLRIEAEKALQPLQENMRPEEDFIKLQREQETLNEQLVKLSQENRSLEENMSLYMQTNENLNLQTNTLNATLERLRQENESLSNESSTLINELNAKNENLQNQISNLSREVDTCASTQVELEHLKSKLTALETEKQNLQILLNEKEIACQNLDSYLQQLEAAKSALESKLEEILRMQNTNNDNEEKIKELTAKLSDIRADVEAKSSEIEKLNNTLVKEREQFSQQLQETTDQLTQEWMIKVDERGSAVAENWKLHVEARENEFSQVEQNLRLELSEVYGKHESLAQENKDLQNKIGLLAVTNMNSSNNELEALRGRLTEKQTQVQKLADEVRNLKIQLENKESEISTLNHSLEGRHAKDIELNKLKTQWIEKEEHYEHLLSTKDSDLENLRVQLNENERRLSKEETDKINCQIQLEAKIAQCVELERRIAEVSNYLTEEQSEKNRLFAELQANIASSTVLDTEINGLKNKLQKEESNRCNLETCLEQKTSECNQLEEKITELEDQVIQKASECEGLRMRIVELEGEFNAQANEFDALRIKAIELEETLIEKATECEELQVKVDELNQLSQAESTQIQELKEMIESQVMKIEELNKELYEKSNEYDALMAEIESFQRKETSEEAFSGEKHVHFKDDEVKQLPSQDVDNLAEPVSRAELDLALYMLHQRDVRCEELTVELMQLLEERDTLQLKLSNAIRVNEELKTKLSPNKLEESERKKESPSRSTGAVPKSKSTAIVLGATGTELATEATETEPVTSEEVPDNKELADKLSQLRSIGYRDKTLKDDQEIRHMQQMTVMQQHRDLASRLPPEAAARLVDASYTLSRDVQSPSKVLLNWLWGRSTPKINDI